MRRVNKSFLLAALAQGQSPAFSTTEGMQKEAKASVILLERLHISKREMASIDMAEVVRTYCENLDGAKMYFTEPEVEEFVNRYAKTLDLYLQHDNPGGDRVSNWLPSPIGPLGVTMRLYQPGTDALSGAWVPPVVRRTD